MEDYVNEWFLLMMIMIAYNRSIKFVCISMIIQDEFCNIVFMVTETLILEFNQYTPGSRWRKTTINRKDHREEGNEADGFYGGIRKVNNEEEIKMWKRLWPVEVLE